MIADARNLFTASTGQSITTDAESDYYLDLNESMNLGIGEELAIFLVVTEAFATLTSGLIIKLESDTTLGFATAKRTELQTRTYLPAELTLGAKFQFSIPCNTLQRYVRLYFDVVNEAATAGKIAAHVGLGRQS